MSVQNSSEQANNRVQLHFVDSKNANQITCSSKRPSRMNYAARLNENVYSAGRTIEHDPNLDCRTEDNTTGIHGPYIGVELEETVDYTCKEALQIVGSTCANSTMTQIRAHSYSPSSKEPTSLLGDQTTLTSMPTRSHTKSVPFSKHSNDEGFDKHTSDTSYEFKKVALEAPDCTHVDVDRTIQLPLSSNDSFEHMLVMEESPSLSFLNFPSVFYDEMCMRKNSLLSSSTEKPLSTSALEASGVTNSSSDVCSGLTKLSNDVPDTCKGTSDIFTKEMDYINIPPPNGAAKEEMQRSVNEQEGDSEQSHDSVPDQNVDQQMTCDLYKEQKCATQENSDKELFERETKSKYTVSDSVQIGTPNARVASSVHNYEDTFLLDSPSGTGACTSTPIPESKNMTFFIPGMEDLPEKVKLVANDCELVKDDIKGTLTLTIKAGDGNVAEKAKKPLLAAANRFKKLDMITFPKPNFKNIKPKVMTRPGTQSKESVTSMLSPRSSQSVSTASSPVASPRGPCPSARLGRKAVGEQDLKPEPVMVKSHQQPINKQLFAVAYSKNVLSKLPRTISALKQSRTDADKASSANSACSFASAAAIACIQSCKVIENKTETPKSLSKPDMSLKQMGPEPNKCNGNIGPQLANQELIKASRSDLSEASTTKVPASTKPPPASSKIVQKDYSSTIRSTAVSKAPAVKPKVPPSGVVRRETASKNIVTNANLSPRRSSQPVSNGLDPSTPRGKSTTGQAFALVTARSLTRSLPRSRLPCKESILQRTPSVSSVCSSQSEQSTYSNRSTATSSLKNEVHSTTTRTKDISGPPAAKALVSKSKVQPLKAAQTGTKPKPVCAYQGAPKPSGPIFTARKVPEGKPQSQTGVAGVFGPRYASVEKSKQKASPKTPCTPAQSSPDERKALEFAQCRAKCERQNGFIVQLKQLIVSSNQRFEAVTIVVQQLLKQREEALKQRRALSQELVSLRGDLVTSSVTCEKLEKEKNELQVAYEGILEKLKEQHQSELEELEEKLKEFYTGECKKLQCVFFDEAEKYKTELQGKVDELNATHEAFRLELETSHSETINHLQEKYELSFSELKDTQEHEKSMLEESFTEKQSSLEKTIDELKSETDSLREKLKFEEEQRKIAKEKSNQKNPHVMYLEQELESLKAVMEIKNEKLHQQDKKLMQVEKLVDNNATLFEKLKKCQQENEDLKARMDKHMALSRQLSTEQAVLQESLQKESKVNKRLSMENEELLWKLHNGDLCSPKKLSPTSPSIPFQSSRSSGSFSSPTVSPR